MISLLMWIITVFFVPTMKEWPNIWQHDYVKDSSFTLCRWSTFGLCSFPGCSVCLSACGRNYGIEQTSEHPEYDYCYCDVCRTKFKEQTGRDPLELKYPMEDQSWINFRLDAISRVVDQDYTKR